MLLIVIICLVRYISIIIIFYSSESKDNKNISNDFLIHEKKATPERVANININIKK